MPVTKILGVRRVEEAKDIREIYGRVYRGGQQMLSFHLFNTRDLFCVPKYSITLGERTSPLFL